MKACEELRTDETLRELAVHGSVQFPFQHYRCRYDAENGNLYPWHWHSEAEAILMLSGETYCLVGNQRMRLRAGEGVGAVMAAPAILTGLAVRRLTGRPR